MIFLQVGLFSLSSVNIYVAYNAQLVLTTGEQETIWETTEVLFDRNISFNNPVFAIVVWLYNSNQMWVMEFGGFCEIDKYNFF